MLELGRYRIFKCPSWSSLGTCSSENHIKMSVVPPIYPIFPTLTTTTLYRTDAIYYKSQPRIRACIVYPGFRTLTISYGGRDVCECRLSYWRVTLYHGLIEPYCGLLIRKEGKNYQMQDRDKTYIASNGQNTNLLREAHNCKLPIHWTH